MSVSQAKREGRTVTCCHCGPTPTVAQDGSLPSCRTQRLQMEGQMPSQTLPTLLPFSRVADKGTGLTVADSKRL